MKGHIGVPDIGAAPSIAMEKRYLGDSLKFFGERVNF
jgi:hypothetical protein